MKTLRQKYPKEHRAWETAKGRCFNPMDKDFRLYGGRGVVMCERWRNSFENFIADMGRKPSRKHQLDRRRNEGNYAPDNCRWATPAQQAQNRRVTKLCATSAVLIRYMRRRGAALSDLGYAFGVSDRTIARLFVFREPGRKRIWGNALADLAISPVRVGSLWTGVY